MNNPIKVPSGVELRGSWDVQHHTQSGGTAIFTNYDGGNAGESGPSLIQLEAMQVSEVLRWHSLISLPMVLVLKTRERPRS